MSATAILLILAAAVAHASWNLFGKQAAATGAASFAWLLAACAALIYLPVAGLTALLTHPHLTGLAWIFLAGTGLLHSGYFLFLQLGYRTGDLSMAYPIGRGTGAMLAAVAGIVLLSERLSVLAGAGILAIIAGVVAIGLPAGQRAIAADPLAAANNSAQPVTAQPVTAQPVTAQPVTAQAAGRAETRATAFALATGVFIACYTIWDKYAVANLRTPPVLQGYAGFVVMTLAFTPFALSDPGRLAQVWRTFRPQVLGAAVLAPLAYLLVLVALSFTAVSRVGWPRARR